jgi:3-methylfumaryl-CoA hydratase
MIVERITPGPAEALAGLLGVPLLPGLGRRRMFAGGRVRRHRPLRVDVETVRCSRLASTTDKQGKSGPMTITTIEHCLSQDGQLVLTDQQDIVCLTAAPASSAAAPAGTASADPPGGWPIPVDPAPSFRFSALTYNAHRIHYDHAYARDVEGYPGLVVRGPLQAIAMATASVPPDGVGDELSYRLVAPLYAGQGMNVHVDRSEVTSEVATRVTDSAGRVTATGSWQRAPDSAR